MRLGKKKWLMELWLPVSSAQCKHVLQVMKWRNALTTAQPSSFTHYFTAVFSAGEYMC